MAHPGPGAESTQEAHPTRAAWGSWLGSTGGAQVAAVVLGAGTNVAYARFLSVSLVGELAVLIALAALIVLLGDAGLSIFAARELAQGRLQAGSALGLFFFVQPVYLTLGWVVVGGVAVGVAPVREALALHSDALFLVLELAAAQWFFQVGLAFFQGTRRYRLRAGLILANALITAGLTAGALALSATVAIALHASAVAYVIVGVAGMAAALRRHRPRRPSLSVARDACRRARPIWINGGVGYFGAGGDVLLAGLVLPTGIVGVYQISKKLAAGALAPITSLLPVVFAEAARTGVLGRTRIYRRLQISIAGLVAIGSLALAPVATELVLALFGEPYASHAYLVLALIGVGALQFSYGLLGYLITAMGWFGLVLRLNVVLAVASVLGAVTLGSAFGLQGFVAGWAAAQVCGIALALRIAAPEVIHRSGWSGTIGVLLIGAGTGIALAAGSMATGPAVAVGLIGALFFAAVTWRASAMLVGRGSTAAAT